MDKISIIVPVYNTNAEMFDKCISSLVNQTYKNVEIILVDDGSTSGIEYSCDKYKEMYPNIKVIHKKNGGLSSARNAGQEVATGDWILFVDSDDWIDCETCENLVEVSKKYDNSNLIVFGFVQHVGNKTINCSFKKDNIVVMDNNNYSLVDEALNFPSLLSSSCWKMYKLSFLNDHLLKHNEEVKQGSEDLEFMIRVLIHTKNITVVNKRFYHYLMNKDSITNSFNEKNTYAVQDCFAEIKHTIDELDSETLYEKFYVRSWYALCSSIISGYMNPNNGLRFKEKKRLAKQYLNTDFAKITLQNVNLKRIEPFRRLVFFLIEHDAYYFVYLIAKARAVQKKR